MNARIMASMALLLSVVSGLCYVAGFPGFQILPWKVANFAGMTAGALAGLGWLAAASGRHRGRASMREVGKPTIGHPDDATLA